jgi:Do/DeqQ family serine protease
MKDSFKNPDTYNRHGEMARQPHGGEGNAMKTAVAVTEKGLRRLRAVSAAGAALCLRIVVAVMFVCVAAAGSRAEHGPLPDSPRVTPVVRAVHAVAPAVVNITTARMAQGAELPGPFAESPLLRELLRLPQRQQPMQRHSLGSGVIIDGSRGLVLTNAHVISGATTIRARLLDGREFEADLLGAAPDFDIAVLRLQAAQSLPQVPMADSSDMMPGETVIAIGNPFGFGHTVTTGVVSALQRSIQTRQGVFTDLIQTDAAINPGNSGGPLINIAGELVGVNTAIQANAEGIGFAIPVNKARRVVDELLSSGRVRPVWLGVEGQDIDQRTGAWLGLRGTGGMLVTRVYADTPAQKAGIQPGDVILRMENDTVQDKDHYLQLLRNHTRGRQLGLQIFRQGELRRTAVVPVALGAQDALSMAAMRWGMRVRDARGQGVVIESVRPDSPAGRLGLQAGDAILQVGGLRTGSLQDFAEAFVRHRLSGAVLLVAARGGRAAYVRMIL